MKGIYAGIPLWGEAYTQRWLELSLPSLLAEGNLPTMARRYPTKVLLFTTREDQDVVLAHPAVKMLRDVCPLRITTIAERREDALKYHAGNLMVACHGKAVAQAWTDDHGFMPLVADMVFSNNSLTTVCDYISAGKRAVGTQAFGVVEKDFKAQVEALGLRQGPVLSIPPRTLVRLLFDTMHPAWASRFWDAPNCGSHPAMMFWRLAERSLLMRVWHLYPLFLYPERRAVVGGSMDDNLLSFALSDPINQCAALDDSDGCVLVDIMDPNKRDDLHSIEIMPHPFNVDYVVAWAEKWARVPHCFNLQKYKIWIHDGEFNRADWQRVEQQSDEIVHQILSKIVALNRPIGTALPRA